MNSEQSVQVSPTVPLERRNSSYIETVQLVTKEYNSLQAIFLFRLKSINFLSSKLASSTTARLSFFMASRVREGKNRNTSINAVVQRESMTVKTEFPVNRIKIIFLICEPDTEIAT
jgi:hypothetical protein